MSAGQVQRQTKGKLKVALHEEYQGIKHVDLFVDYTSPVNRLAAIQNSSHTITDYARKILAPIGCPTCHSKKMTLNLGGGLKERFLKIFGRRIFLCSECNTKKFVKIHRWEWEIVGTVLAAVLVFALFSVRWVIH